MSLNAHAGTFRDCWKLFTGSDSIQLRANRQKVSPDQRDLLFPNVNYRFLKTGETPESRIADYFGVKELKLVASGDTGGFRRVYQHPKDPNKVIKIYKTEFTTYNNVTKAMEPVSAEGSIPLLIQREWAIQDFLIRNKVRVAYVDQDAALAELGAVTQVKLGGSDLSVVRQYFDHHPTIDPKVESVMVLYRKSYQAMLAALRRQYGRTLPVESLYRLDVVAWDADGVPFPHEGNFRVVNTDDVWLIDW